MCFGSGVCAQKDCQKESGKAKARLAKPKKNTPLEAEKWRVDCGSDDWDPLSKR